MLHASVAGYQQAIGAGSSSTLGSGLVLPAKGAVKSRRIDLRADVADVLTVALPHELCHVVIADHFRDGLPPLWFDEGLAIQYDGESKRKLHERDFRDGALRGEIIALDVLLRENSYPSPGQWGMFYGESGSLVRWMLAKRSPLQLLEFVKQSRTTGVQRATQNAFEGAGMDEVYRMWRHEAVALDAPVPAEFAPSTAVWLQLASR